MSKSSGSDLSGRPGDDSDLSLVSIIESHASGMPYTPDSRKRAQPKQIRGKAWIFHGIITTDEDQLHTKSESNEALLHAHWTSVVQHLDDKIKKLIGASSFISSCSATSQASWHV
jgi:hypothetical protein